MSDEILHDQAAIPEQQQVADTSVTADSPQTPAPDTGETAAETDEQRAERLVKQNEVRRQREQRKLNQRFSEITSERDAYKMALELLKQGQAPQQRAPVQQADEDREPQEADFDDWNKYQRAVARWEAKQVVKTETQTARQKWEQEQREAQQRQTFAQTLGQFEQRREQFAKADPSYDQAAEALEQIPVGPHNLAMAEAILHHPDSPKVLKFLGQNLQEADRISRLPPVLQVAAIGEIAAALKYQPPQTSKAPPPGVPVGGRGSATTEPKSASDYYDKITAGWKQGKR